MTIFVTTHDSPIGSLTLTAQRDGALLAILMADQRHRRPDDPTWRPDRAPFAEVITQLDTYFAGELRHFDLPLHPVGTPFQLQVWSALREIPYGSTISYRQLAEHVGRPKAVRAVGLANGRNPLSIVVPCHRVVGANGSLTGYGGGLERKRLLLELEGALAAPALPL